MASKYTVSAKGRDCEIRIPGVCNRDPDTVVLCHLPSHGMGSKSDDIHGAFGCYDCHQAVDGHIKTDFAAEFIKLYHLQAVIRTQEIWRREGLL